MSEDSVFNRGSYEEFHCVYDETCPSNNPNSHVNEEIPAVNTQLSAQTVQPSEPLTLFRSGGDTISTFTNAFGVCVIIFLVSLFFIDSLRND